jgi:hypothetical protein
VRPEFDKSLRAVARPALEKHGYAFDGRRRFVRQTGSGKDLVIEFQLGVRSAQGRFTVNLIAGDQRARLAMLRPSPAARVVERLLGDRDPWWKGIFLPKDRWWPVSSRQPQMDAAVGETIAAIEAYGLSWLEGHVG